MKETLPMAMVPKAANPSRTMGTVSTRSSQGDATARGPSSTVSERSGSGGTSVGAGSVLANAAAAGNGGRAVDSARSSLVRNSTAEENRVGSTTPGRKTALPVSESAGTGTNRTGAVAADSPK